MTLVKIVLAGAGIATFGVGINLESSSIRWAGIGLVAAAWLARFADRRDARDARDARDDDGRDVERD
jgi:hypothetical protein